MYTECPSCHTFFKVTPAHLKIADGRVRCGSCNEVFNALESLTEEVPASALEARKQRSQPEADSKSNLTSEVEELDSNKESDSLADIEIPGTEESLDDNDDSSLSGLAGSEPVDLENLDSLSDLSGLSDIASTPKQESKQASALDELSDIDVPTQEQSQTKQSTASDISGISDIDLSDIEAPSDLSSAAKNQSEQATTSVDANDLNDINREIDDALDGLFDDSTQVETESGSASEFEKPSQLLKDTDLSDIPDLDNDGDLAELGLGDEKLQRSDSMDFELDLSDESSDALESRAAGKAGKKSEKSKTSGLDDFELGDSLLDSGTLDIDDSDWSPDESNSESSEMYSGDSFILEELDDEPRKTASEGLSKTFWVSLIFVLIIILAGQAIYLKRESLAQYPQIVPILELECKLIGLVMPCEIPARRDTSKIELVERNIVSHPSAENALLITSTIKNTADYVQPFPKMVLTFSDINQKVVARRVFSPEEYLAKDVNLEQGMQINEPIKIILEIVDPGEEAVNFQFDFK